MAAKRSAKRSTKKPAARGKKPAVKTKARVKAKVKTKAKAPKKVAAKRGAARAPKPRAAAARAKPAAAASKSRFVWFDLVTPDAQKSAEFYKPLFGWSSKDLDVPPPGNRYTMFSAGGEDFGGLAPKMDSPAPTHWLPYVLVENVDETVRRAALLGGKVFMEPMDIPNVGRFAIIADPTGATVAPISFLTPPSPAPAQGLAGPVAWCELYTGDTAQAGQFYSQLLGWGREEMDMGPMGKYTIFKSGERSMGGMMARMPDQPASMWLTYFGTDNVDAKHGQAVAAGARELTAPGDIPKIGRFSILMDPQGAVFALFKGAPTQAA